MKVLAPAAALVMAAAPAALAQDKEAMRQCEQQIEEVAQQVPDLTANPEAYKDMGVDKEQLQAALAALDAARLLSHHQQHCETMVNAARSVLAPQAG